MIRGIQILILLLCFQTISISQEMISFEGEEIEFEIKDDVFIVKGIYYFKSDTNNTYPILYPFPNESIYSKPFNIHVNYLDSGKSIKFKTSKDSSSIIFPLEINEKTAVLVSYNQILNSRQGKYILLTTRNWNKPLKIANFKLITDTSLLIKRFSMPPDNVIIIENKKIYFWQKEHFMPIVDFEINF